MPDGKWPTVAILVPAYNEEKVIAAKIENCLALNYEQGKLEILVGSDGSTDRTNEIVKGYSDPRIKLIELSGRNGKTGVLNKLVEQTGAEILVTTDANVMLDSDSMMNLIRHFADPSVGVVNGGKYIVIPKGAEALQGEVIYGSYENSLRTHESEVGGMSGALGSLMAVKRELYHPYPKGSTNDDTVPSLWAALIGLRQVHDPEAKAFEESGHNISEEFQRRKRIGAGNFQTLFRYSQVLQPKYGLVAYSFASHKVLRWIFPFLMLLALLSNLILINDPIYRLLFICQLLGYTLAILGWLFDCMRLRVPIISSIYHFVAMNFALFLGFFVYLRGIKSAAWERTAREVNP